MDFDRKEGLRSLPASLGVARALAIARAMHVGTVLLLLVLFRLAPLHPLYLAGVAGVAAILAWEHSLARPTDLTQVMRAGRELMRTLVAGFGNVLRGDDGFGVAVIQKLQAEASLGDEVELMEVGTGGLRMAQELLAATRGSSSSMP